MQRHRHNTHDKHCRYQGVSLLRSLPLPPSAATTYRPQCSSDTFDTDTIPGLKSYTISPGTGNDNYPSTIHPASALSLSCRSAGDNGPWRRTRTHWLAGRPTQERHVQNTLLSRGPHVLVDRTAPPPSSGSMHSPCRSRDRRTGNTFNRY